MASDRKPTEYEKNEARRLAKLRRETSKSQEWLAEQLGVTPQQWSKAERGENRIPLERFQKAEHILLQQLGRLSAQHGGLEEAGTPYTASGPAHVNEIIAGITSAREALDRVEALIRSLRR